MTSLTNRGARSSVTIIVADVLHNVVGIECRVRCGPVRVPVVLMYSSTMVS